MKLFSHGRHWSDIGRCVFHNSCLILISATELQNSYEISNFLEPPRANLRYGADFEWLFLQFSIVIAAFKHAHLMDGDLIELDQTFLLWHTLFNKHRIEILHIGETY